LSLFLELIEPEAPLFAYGCWGALYKYLNTIQYKRQADFNKPMQLNAQSTSN